MGSTGNHARLPRHVARSTTPGRRRRVRQVAPRSRPLPTVVPLGAAALLTAVSMAGVVLTQSTVGLSVSSAAGAEAAPVLRATVTPVSAIVARSTSQHHRTYAEHRSEIEDADATGPAKVVTVNLPVPGCPAPVDPDAFANGKIPAADLCPLPGAPGQLLRSDAAAAWAHLDTAYTAHFDTPLCITDSYRSLKVQKQTFKRKPLLAAVPGTSNHGLGIAVDLCGGIDHADSVTHAWMQDNAPRFGWTNPAWAQPDGSKPEPWHWEYAAPSTSATP